MKIELMQVKKAVYSWSIRFKEIIRSNDELLQLSEEFTEDLEDENVSEREFAFAAKSVRKSCTFFPKMVDILDAVGVYRANPPVCDTPQLAEYTDGDAPMTPDQEERNKKRLAILADISCGKLTHEEGARKMEYLLDV